MSTTKLTSKQQILQRDAWFQEAQRLGNAKLAWRKWFFVKKIYKIPIDSFYQITL